MPDAAAALPIAERPTLGRTAAAFLRRDLAVMASYRFTVALRTLSVIVVLASFAWLARFVGAPAAESDVGGAIARYGGAGFVGFWVIGVAVGDFSTTLAVSLAVRLREAQLEGTLEAMLATPAPAPHVVACLGLADLIVASVRLVASLAFAALVLDVSFARADLRSVALVGALSITAFAALGVLGGALTMWLRRLDPVSALVGAASMIIGGVFYPTSVLPKILRVASWGLPSAPSLEGLRLAIFAGAPPSAIGAQLAALAIFTVVVGPLGVWLFARSLARARDDGSLGGY